MQKSIDGRSSKIANAAIEYNDYLQLNVSSDDSWRDKLAGGQYHGSKLMVQAATFGFRFMRMKTTYWLPTLTGLLALVGCGKSGKNPAQGVPATMDSAEVPAGFPPTQEQQGNIAKVARALPGIRMPWLSRRPRSERRQSRRRRRLTT